MARINPSCQVSIIALHRKTSFLGPKVEYSKIVEKYWKLSFSIHTLQILHLKRFSIDYSGWTRLSCNLHLFITHIPKFLYHPRVFCLESLAGVVSTLVGATCFRS